MGLELACGTSVRRRRELGEAMQVGVLQQRLRYLDLIATGRNASFAPGACMFCLLGRHLLAFGLCFFLIHSNAKLIHKLVCLL